MMKRDHCPICKKNPRAINYYRGEKIYYRTLCTPCIHKKKRPLPEVPGWARAGYKKSEKCDRCAFTFKLPDQSQVYYVDGNTNNNNWLNLRTICLNCSREVTKTKWRPSGLRPDL